MNILLTGGAGYIGTHTAVALTDAGYAVILLDNFSNSNRSVLGRLEKILGKALPCIEADVRNTDIVSATLLDYKIDAVIHFAGLKAVGESVVEPVEYYANNVQGAISLLKAMSAANVRSLIFSSSATVYGDPQYLPIDESHPTGATNPYGRNKLHIEEMLKDVADSDPFWKIVCLRYFNPVGAHESGLIGEDPSGIPNNLFPYISQVASGSLSKLSIYGGDYPTVDGTGIRDYIHVSDLAEGHVAALSHIAERSGWDAINLGTGKGLSVLEVLREYERVSGEVVNYSIVGRRAGDVSSCYSAVDKAKKVMGWQANRTIQDMCSSLFLWQKYRGSSEYSNSELPL